MRSALSLFFLQPMIGVPHGTAGGQREEHRSVAENPLSSGKHTIVCGGILFGIWLKRKAISATRVESGCQRADIFLQRRCLFRRLKGAGKGFFMNLGDGRVRSHVC